MGNVLSTPVELLDRGSTSSVATMPAVTLRGDGVVMWNFASVNLHKKSI